MKIKELMTTVVEVLDPEASLKEAAMMMADSDIGALPVVDDGEVVGFLTDRDIVVRAVAEGVGPSESTVAEIMSKDVAICRESEDLAAVKGRMMEKQVRRIVVLDGNGRLTGIVSLSDIALKGGGAGEVLEQVCRAAGAAETAAAGTKTSDLGFLAQDELAAVETYKLALEKVKGPAGEELRRIEAEHEEAVALLRARLQKIGQEFPRGSGLWGAWSRAIEGTAKVFGDKAALKALKEGEEHDIHDYEKALSDESVSADIKELISSELLPKTRAHVPALDRFLRKTS
jgi:CBS domain-containing protein